MTTDKEVQELRDKLRGKRTDSLSDSTRSGEPGTSSSNSEASTLSGGDTKQHSTNKPTKTGHSIQSVSGSGATASLSDGQSNNSAERSGSSARGLAPIDLGKRQAARRPSENNGAGRPDGSNLSASNQTTTGSGRGRSLNKVGNLITDEEIPIRVFKDETNNDTKATGSSTQLSIDGSGKATKSSVKSNTKSKISQLTSIETRKGVVENVAGAIGSLVKEGSTLTQKETSILEEPLKEAIKDFARYGDEALWKRQDNMNDQPIWSDMDDDELHLLVTYLLKSGQKSPMMAKVVRNTVSSHDYIALYMILAPRVVKTSTIIQRTHKPRVKKQK